MSTFDLQMEGDAALVAKFDSLNDRIYAALVRTMTALGIRLQAIVVEQKLSGQVLKRQSGKLASSINFEIGQAPNQITSTVGFNKATVPYGVFQEFGVPHSWVIEAKNAKALRFTIGGQVFFRKKVTHPGLQERSFLRSALAQIAPEVGPAIEAAIAAEVRA
jgi:hypothetical protein